MVQIMFNLALFAAWVALTAALTVGVSILGQNNPSLGGSSAFAIWLVGQLVIMSPLLVVIWRRRRMDFE